MRRRFNTAGPCRPADHYMLPALRRIPQVRELIDQKAYFVVYAPRQVGKTTTLMALGAELTREAATTRSSFPWRSARRFAAIPALPNSPCSARGAATRSTGSHPISGRRHGPTPPPDQRIQAALNAWALASPRPLVLFLELPAIEVGRELRHMPRSGARSKPTIEVAVIEVSPPAGRRSGRPVALRRSA